MTDRVLTTARLTLRPATPDDAEAFYRLRTLPEVSRWIPFSAATPLEEFTALFADRYPLFWVVERHGAFVGEVMLRIESAPAQYDVRDRSVDNQAELGWVVHPDHQRQGYATEAVTRMLEHCFDELGLRRVTAGAFAGNEATAALAPRLGFRLEAVHVKATLHRTEGWVDSTTYALLAEEWRAAQA